MKKFLVLAMICSLMLVTSVAASGAIHDSYGDFWTYAYAGNIIPYDWATMGEWYYIEKDDPFYQVAFNNGMYNGAYYESYNQPAAELWLGDQTFMEGYLFHYNGGSDWAWQPGLYKGSYLTKMGIFAGISYFSYGYDGTDNETVISLGYSFNLNDNGYIALSIDYYADDYDGMTMGYEIDFKYYFEKMKLFGQIYLPTDAIASYWGISDEMSLDVNLNYKVSETFVFGVRLADLNDYYGSGALLGIGFTWKPSFMLLDLKTVGYDDIDANLTAASAMFAINEDAAFGIGYEKYSGSSDAGVFFKGYFKLCEGQFSVAYRLHNDSYDSALFLRYKKSL